MRLVDKLIEYIHGAFDKSPKSFVALRLRHRSESFRWSVSGRVIRGYVNGAEIFSIPLVGKTIRKLVDALWLIDGVDVPYTAGSDYLDLSAACLIDGSGAQSMSNGDMVVAYSSILWVILDALSVELDAAKNGVVSMLEQMSIKTAKADWLDEWGDYFGVHRASQESDEAYSRRIIVEVMRPRGNNRAIELALKEQLSQDATVVDVVRWTASLHAHNGTSLHDGDRLYDASAFPIYGLFEVVIGYDLLSGEDLSEYADAVRAFIENFRDAGTQMDNLRLSSSAIDDFFIGESDGGNSQPVAISMAVDDALINPSETVPDISVNYEGMVDSMTSPSEAAVDVSILFSTTHNGLRQYGGEVPFASGFSSVESV